MSSASSLPEPSRSESSLPKQTVRLRRNIQLAVSYNAGDPPAIVFIHGGLGNRYNWRIQYEFACAQGWQALAYDLAGHGQSSAYRRYSIGRHQRDLVRLLRHFHIHKPILCCHSYGVPIGLEWARRHPVAGLVLVAGGTHDLAPWWEIPLMKVLAWGGRHLYRWQWVQRLTGRLSSRQSSPLIRRFFADCPVPTEAEPYEALEIFWGYDFFAQRRRRRFNCPVLVVSGGQDSMFSETMGANLAAVFPRGEHLHLPDAGHLVMAEYPEVINQAIADFRVKHSARRD